jgi:xanthine dehydrogenase small subunit
MPEQPISRPIRFFHRGAVVEVGDAATTRTVLDWLREDARCSGTKEGCNEGDCGACTVVIGEAAAPGDPAAVRGLSLKTVNACIQFLPTLDGKALFTVEDLKPMAAGRLHPVQQAMVECHGSQCGFCTPGFVMSLWSAYEHHQACATRPTRQQLADELSGNLCRCTGYRPILDAGQQMFDLSAVRLDTAPVLEALRRIRPDGTLGYAAGASAGAPRFFAPTTLAELAALRVQRPGAQLLAGSTDIGLWVNKQFRPVGDLLYVGAVDELKRIDTVDGELRIGAGASLETAWAALAARFPALTDVWLRFASPPIRNVGTMGGNVANGSPIGDSAPVLIALDAQVELRQGARLRRMALQEFYLDYMKNQLEPGEFVQGIAVPLAAVAARQVRAYKISKRFDSDISAVCGGFSIALDNAGVVAAVRLAYGGMAAIVKRAARTEAALVGQPRTQASVDAAKAALADDIAPLTDMRASAAYRLQVAQNLLQRLWLETRAENPLPSSATSVFSVMPHVTV